MWNENRNHCKDCRYYCTVSDASFVGDPCSNSSSYSYGRPIHIPQKEGCGNFVDACLPEEKKEVVA